MNPDTEKLIADLRKWALRVSAGYLKVSKPPSNPLATIAQLAHLLTDTADRLVDMQQVIDDKHRLTRELDVAMHGEEGAAKQASLCDLIGPARDMRKRITELTAAQPECVLLRKTP